MPYPSKYIKIKKCWLALLVGLFCFLWVEGQVLRDSFRFIPERVYFKGLGSRDNFDLKPYEDGTWWLGARNGLYRFDGTSFHKKELKNLEGRIIKDPIVQQVIPSKVYPHKLYLCLKGMGLLEYDIQLGKGKHHRNDPRDSLTIHGNGVQSFIEEPNGNFWVCTSSFMLSYFDRKANHFIHYRPPLDFSHPVTTSKATVLGEMVVCPINPQHFWLGTLFGLYRFDKISKEFTFFPFEKAYDYFYTVYNITLYADTLENVLWVGKAQDGLWRYDPKTGQPLGKGLLFSSNRNHYNNFVTSIFAYDEKTLFLGTRHDKIMEVNRQTNELLYQFMKVPTFETHTFYEDKNGELWVCSNKGLFRFTRQKERQKFRPLTEWFGKRLTSPIKENQLDIKNNWLRADAFSRDGQRLYLGTKRGDGLLIYEIAQDSFWYVRYKSGIKYSEPDVLLDAVCEDDQKTVWIGSDDGLLFYKEGMERIQKKNAEILPIDEKRIRSLAFRSPYLYIGFILKGMYRLDVRNGIITPFSPEHIAHLDHHSIYQLFFNDKGDLWIGTNNGLYIYNPEKNIFLDWTTRPGGGKWLKEVSIADIAQTQNGDMYFTTGGDGLVAYHRAENQWKNYLNHGYRRNYLNELVVLPNQNLLINAKNSFLEFNPFLPYENFPEFKRIPSRTEFERSLIAFADGRVWAGSNRGITEFYPSQLKSPYAALPLYLKGIKVLGEDKFTPPQLRELKQLALPYNENSISIEPGAVNFEHNGATYLFQKLEGVDPEWIRVEADNTFTYANLSPGVYRYLYKASDQSGRWSKDIGSLDIVIQPPWWRSNWAYLVYFMLFLGALGLARRQIIQRERLRNELEKEQLEKEKALEIDQLRARFYANISHEFRTPLTLIKAPLEDLLTSRKNDTARITFFQMHQNTERLLHLVNQLLDLSRLESGVLELKTQSGDIYTLVRQLAANFQSLAAQKALDFQVDVPVETLFLEYDQDKIEKIVLNLLSNAIKFAPDKGWVKMEASFGSISAFDKSNAVLHLRIGNNGDPIPEKEQPKLFERFYQAGDTRHQGTGIGLALVRELVELHQGKVGLESTKEKGTWFWVALPLNRGKVKALQELSSLKLEEKMKALQELSPLEPDKKVKALQEFSSLEPGKKMKAFQRLSSLSPKLPLLLLVEDHQEVRTYIKSKFQTHFQIIEAEDGVDGFEKAIAKLPDLIISDLMMPKMDGLTLCEKIKTDHRTDHIPFILLTAKADINSRLKGLETRADDYLAKPFNSQELLLRVQNQIHQKQIWREKFIHQFGHGLVPINLPSAAQQFVKKAIEIVEQQIDNFDFSAGDFAEAMLLSRSQFHRKLKSITGQSASEFIRQVRLHKAAQLLQAQADSVTQIAYQVGFNNLSYFAKCFKEKYGVSPSEYPTR